MVQNALAPLAFDTMDVVVASFPRRLEMVLLGLAILALCCAGIYAWRLRAGLGRLEPQPMTVPDEPLWNSVLQPKNFKELWRWPHKTWVLDTKLRWICDSMSVDARLVTRSTSRMEAPYGIAMMSAMSCTIVAVKLGFSSRARFALSRISWFLVMMPPDFFDEHAMRVVNAPPGMRFN